MPIEGAQLYFVKDFASFTTQLGLIPDVPLPEDLRDTRFPTVGELLGRTEPPIPFESPVYRYPIKEGEEEKIRQTGEFIITRWKTWPARKGFPIRLNSLGKPEYPCRAGMIKSTKKLQISLPKGICLTPLERRPGEKTIEKTQGKKRIFYRPPDSILGAITCFYKATRARLQLVFYETPANRKLYQTNLSKVMEKFQSIRKTGGEAALIYI